MIIKSLSRKTPSFGQIINYVSDPGKRAGEAISFNMPLSSQSIEASFLENSRYSSNRKNGVKLFHEVLSFHECDADKITPQILRDLANEYLLMRCPEALAYACIHNDTKNPHIHIIISGNLIGSRKSLRISRSHFARIKRDIEEIQRSRYPELSRSLVQGKKSGEVKEKRKVQEFERDKRLFKQGKNRLSQKEKVKNRVNSALNAANNTADFHKIMMASGVSFYQNGQRTGVICRGKKYRLTTLGVAQKVEEKQEGWKLEKIARTKLNQLSLSNLKQRWIKNKFYSRIRRTLKNVLPGRRRGLRR